VDSKLRHSLLCQGHRAEGVCKNCGKTQVRPVKQRVRNGIFQVYLECQVCGEKCSEWLKQKQYDMDSLTERAPKGEYPLCSHCGAVGAELHHYAPQALFEDANHWSVGYLCKRCHKEWHEVMTP